MNTANYDVSPPPRGPLRRDVPQTPAQYHHQVIEEILPEERELFRNCMYGTVIKNGVPFAVFLHCLSKYSRSKAVNPVAPKSSLMRALSFFGNVIFGSLIFSPICVSKLRDFHEENKKIRKEMLSTNAPAVEGTSASSGSEDFSYPSDLISGLNEPESSFSLDFTPSNFLINEEEKKFIGTTYEDLRTQHRSGASQSNKKPASQLNFEPEHGLDELSSSTKPSTLNEPPRARVTKKNKYGDEME